ncbi:hypothetical protein IM660_03825 [Ruania alkalisoli]|uniref:Alpha-galactosidase n=1 Tax=Ruania alkalisoli TaxID=2779775 RepID=A0A7M1SWM2_9MICO|nr:hypothetical protein [Ruania alkalisoli]QOR71437.1 hypothetical protein IM660_03825 [Ruania alkalisoli]
MSDRVTFRVPCAGPVLLPALNAWGQDVYLQQADFELDPVTVAASSTSGSPVLLAEGLFVGVLSPMPGTRFRRVDGVLEVSSEADLFVRTGAEPFDAWAEYSRVVIGGGWRTGPTSAFHDAVEYCTWVEQKARATRTGGTAREALDEGMLNEFLDRIDAMDLPRGKVTIDDGWAPGNAPGGVGDWEPDTERFADLDKTAARIRARGHVPGLWFAPGRAALRSAFRAADPAAFHPVADGAAETGSRVAEECYADATSTVLDHYRRVFGRYAGMGFEKFKLDLYYGPKHRMTSQLQLAYAAIKEIDPGLEVEHHVPDVFASRWADVVRSNDVLVGPGRPWRSVATAHWLITRWSAPDTVVNLDHIGGNAADVTAEDFCAHLDLMDGEYGHPVVSLLPDRFGDEVVQRLRHSLATHHAARPLQTRPPAPPSWEDYQQARAELRAREDEA